MAEFWRRIWILYRKDLLEEFRSMDHLWSTVVFGTMLVFVFSFALQLADVSTRQVFPAVLWVSIFFLSVVALQRSFAKEKESAVMDALLLACGERSLLFYGKFLFSFTLLLLLEAVVVPLFWIFLDVDGAGVNLGLFAAAVLAGSWGLAAVGTLLNGITSQLPSARLLFPILAFPLLIPLLIGVVLCTQGALAGQGRSIMGWLYLVFVFDLIFTILPLVLFDYILEG